MIATSQNMVPSTSGVSLAKRLAGATEKLTPAVTSSTTENTRIIKAITSPM
ncbi:hypothetical protein [Candidatus Pseudoscillospira sp. SGI.172]|uniref:hypothetical protein n=1 Tax=Candidatus Pseudoscillospira sp. SGI.172 TaxID=3420582 RepID=UPI003D04463F